MSDRDHAGRAEPADTGAVTGIPWRGRTAVAASILGVLLMGTYFAAAPGGLRTPWGHWLLNAAILAVAFLIPALQIGSVPDVAHRWKRLLLWALAWTVVWDAATSGILLERGQEMFQQWWIVYPAGIITLFALFFLHGAVMGWVARRRASGSGQGLAGR
jgi:hypothetical protein